MFLEFSELYPDQMRSGDDRYGIRKTLTDGVDPPVEKNGDGPPTSNSQPLEVLISSPVENMDTRSIFTFIVIFSPEIEMFE